MSSAPWALAGASEREAVRAALACVRVRAAVCLPPWGHTVRMVFGGYGAFRQVEATDAPVADAVLACIRVHASAVTLPTIESASC